MNTLLTLSDINEITDSFDGDIFSDVYKTIYGTRPRNIKFASLEQFDEAMLELRNQLMGK